MTEYVLILVAESEDVIIVKKPICAICVEKKAKVTILNTYPITNEEISKMFKPVKAYNIYTGKYVESTWIPRILSVKCVCDR